MAVILPFRGIRFNPTKIEKLEDVVTPPYDVIDPNAEAAFLAKTPYSMIQLDLGKKSSITRGEGRFSRARDLFENWRHENILLLDAEPSIYLYFVEYTHPTGVRLTRKGMVALVGLAEFSEGVVKPHEKTFADVRSDRLKLLDACRAQFSQIFSLYSDKEGKIMSLLETKKSDQALASAVDQDGCRHTVWRVTSPEAIAEAARLFHDRSLYIADGHHRYTTALEFRRVMENREGALDPTSPYQYVMMYLCPMEDPGLSILPTHRLVRTPRVVSAEEVTASLDPGFIIEEITGGSRETLVGEILSRLDENRQSVGAQSARATFGLYHAGEDRSFLLELKDGVMEKHFGSALPKSLRDLDVVVLSELLLDRLLDLEHEKNDQDNLIDYYSDPDEAIDIVVKEAQTLKDRTPILFLMNPTTVEQVRCVADEGLIMPHKSTYFYPKILTGLLMREMHER